MIEACGTCELKDEATKIFQDIKKDSIEPSVDTFNAYFQACGKAVHAVNRRPSVSTVIKIPIEEDKESTAQAEKERKQREKLLKMLHKVVIELSIKCNNVDCKRLLREEEIISAWARNLHAYSIKCPACGKEFIPTLKITFSQEKSKSYYFLFPPLFAKEVHNLVENKTASIFFKVF